MSGVSLPTATYPLREALGDEIIAGQKLSSLQLEGALYACQRHSRFLPGASTPTRHGFFLGDGAGVGKGRQVSAIILDNFARGRRKHCWFSVSADLRLDAERDLNDIGACGINLIDGHKGIDGGMAKDGVLFSTYLMLVSSVSQSSGKQAAKGGKGAKRQKTRRMDQLIKWCGGAAFDGCIIFDECHKAKNYREGAGLGTKIGAAVVELQKEMPLARIVYCSATGVTDLDHMAYMERLGLWGPGTQFTGFSVSILAWPFRCVLLIFQSLRECIACPQNFLAEMKNRGVGALEMLAIEMKSSGTYVSRVSRTNIAGIWVAFFSRCQRYSCGQALGFKSAEFALVEARLSDADRRVYDSAAGFWERLRKDLLNAIEETNSPSTVLRQYWSAHQRFFKQLCISLKLPKIVAEAQAALEQGKCVVIGLQATGESALEEHISQTKAAGKKSAAVTFEGFVSVTKFILTSFIESHLPTIRLEKPPTVVKYHDDGTQEFSDGSLRKIDGTVVPPPTPQPAPTGPPQPLSRLVTLRSELLAAAEALDLPASPLDDLIDRLGGPDKVAEMTGRKGRLVRIDSTKTQYFERGKADAERETLNVQECKDFQAGRKLVGIISDAASTGISLHASRRAGNTRRRVHITIGKIVILSRFACCPSH